VLPGSVRRPLDCNKKGLQEISTTLEKLGCGGPPTHLMYYELASGFPTTPFTGPPAGGIKVNRTPFKNDFKRSNVVNRPAAR